MKPHWKISKCGTQVEQDERKKHAIISTSTEQAVEKIQHQPHNENSTNLILKRYNLNTREGGTKTWYYKFSSMARELTSPSKEPFTVILLNRNDDKWP